MFSEPRAWRDFARTHWIRGPFLHPLNPLRWVQPVGTLVGMDTQTNPEATDRYIAVQSMDAFSCQALGWRRFSIRAYVVATGRTAEQAYDRAIEAGAPTDAVVYDTEEGCEVTW